MATSCAKEGKYRWQVCETDKSWKTWTKMMSLAALRELYDSGHRPGPDTAPKIYCPPK